MPRSPESAPARTAAPGTAERPSYNQPELPFDDGGTPEAPVGTGESGTPAGEAPSAGTEGEAPSLPGEHLLYEAQLADKLHNPELKGTRKIRNSINKAAVKTINGIETAFHAGKDIKSQMKTGKLEGRVHRATRKKERLERKRDRTRFQFRKNRLNRKISKQRRTVARRTNTLDMHNNQVQDRHDRRAGARTMRQEAYEFRRQEHLARAQKAARRKIERQYRRLETQQRVLERREQTAASREQIRRLEQRKVVIGRAIGELIAKQATKSEMGLAA